MSGDYLTGGDRVKVFHKVNTTHLVSVKAPYGEHRIVLCNEAVKDATHFVDSIANKVVEVDNESRVGCFCSSVLCSVFCVQSKSQ